MTPTPEKLYRFAADTFLCESLPDNYFELTEAEQDLFLEDNAWEPFEGAGASALRAHIESLADSTGRFFQEVTAP